MEVIFHCRVARFGVPRRRANETLVSWVSGLVLETPNRLSGFETANFYASERGNRCWTMWLQQVPG